LRNHLIHHVEHGLFLGLGILFWAQVIDQHPFHARLGQFKRVVYVFTATIQAWALAALLAFATAPFYAYALLPSRPGGISALTDQQFGAGIMWVPGSITYSIVFIVCIYLWFRDEDARGRAFTTARGVARRSRRRRTSQPRPLSRDRLPFGRCWPTTSALPSRASCCSFSLRSWVR